MPFVFRSIHSLLDEAKASTDPSLAARCVVAACAQAGTSMHWNAILDRMPPTLSDADRLAVVAAAIASAHAREDATTCVKAAVVQARSLRDEVSARATLRAAEEIVSTAARSAEPLAFEWGVVAQGFRDALNDRDEARRTLERGWDLAWSARDVDGLGRIVARWAVVLDREEAIERLSRVEGAALEWGGLRSIVYSPARCSS